MTPTEPQISFPNVIGLGYNTFYSIQGPLQDICGFTGVMGLT